MPDLKINQLTLQTPPGTTRLIAHADPTTGVAGYCTIGALPFVPKGTPSTNGTVPVFNSSGAIVDSGIRDTGSLLAFDRRCYITATTSAYALGISMGSTASAGEQNVIDISSTAGYSGYQMINTGSGYSAIRLVSRNGVTPLGSIQIYTSPTGESVLRSAPGSLGIVPQEGGVFQVRGQTAPNTDNWFTVFPTGNARFDNGIVDPGVKLLVGGTIRATLVGEYADNAGAVAGGLAIGTFYRTGDLLKIVHA